LDYVKIIHTELLHQSAEKPYICTRFFTAGCRTIGQPVYMPGYFEILTILPIPANFGRNGVVAQLVRAQDS
jgi:hypothetical protein